MPPVLMSKFSYRREFAASKGTETSAEINDYLCRVASFPAAVAMALSAISGRPTSHLLVASLTKCQVRRMQGSDVLIRIVTLLATRRAEAITRLSAAWTVTDSFLHR
jgi:hypothetical protein